MLGPIVFLLLSIAAGLVGLLGVADAMGGIVQTTFFFFLVVFVILMVRRIADDR